MTSRGVAQLCRLVGCSLFACYNPALYHLCFLVFSVWTQDICPRDRSISIQAVCATQNMCQQLKSRVSLSSREVQDNKFFVRRSHAAPELHQWASSSWPGCLSLQLVKRFHTQSQAATEEVQGPVESAMYPWGPTGRSANLLYRST